MRSISVALGLLVLFADNVTSQADKVVVAGGFLGGQSYGYPVSDGISVLSEDGVSWVQTASMQQPRVDPAYGSFNDGQLIFLGGDFSYIRNETETYRVGNQSTTIVAPATRQPGVYGVTFRDYFYTVASFDVNNQARYNRILRYNRLTDTWVTLQETLRFGRNVAAKVVYNQYIYFFGGSVSQTAERFNPVTGVSELLSATPWTGTSPSDGNPKAVRLGYYIYILGFKQQGAETRTVYRYDPFADTYSTVASLNVPRAYVAATVANGKIYAIGGEIGAGQVFTNSFEVFDPNTNLWTLRNAGQIYPNSDRGVASHAAFTARSNRVNSTVFVQLFSSSCANGQGTGAELVTNTCTTFNGNRLTITPNSAYTSVTLSLFRTINCQANSVIRTQTVKLNTCTSIGGQSFVMSQV